MESRPKVWGKRRSLVRRIGSMLPLRPPPKIYVRVTPLHSMSNSMINEGSHHDLSRINGCSSENGRLSGSKPDLFEPISFGSEVRLLALEQELQELRTQVSQIIQNTSYQHHSSLVSLSNKNENTETHLSVSPSRPPLPPPLPPPSTPHIARRASLQDHKLEDRKKPFVLQKSMADMLNEIHKVHLKPIARTPGGHPIRPKRENSPCSDLQEILRRRYEAMSASPNSVNSSYSTMDESFT
ncbi:mitochondrial fission regulator 2-like [Chelonus insularis]|uniref:mitochondrial fission regulator 2-like n=1 Tax=Chelonus insularis TaxID=460826 RepID=UPI00158CC0D2|nr:mitochondrial fission regulator 2-like [Chelonus insularis]